MRAHLQALYAGVTVKHSYVRADHHYDCVPLMQQPSVRALGLKALAAAPSAPGTAPSAGEATPPLAASVPGVDPYGNTMHCEAGTIPMRRATMEDLGRFATLADFFRKASTGAAGSARTRRCRRKPRTSTDTPTAINT